MRDPAAGSSRERRRIFAFVTGAAVCYVVGYPLALAGHSDVGWIFVAMGGPFLFGLGIMVIRRVHLSAERSRLADAPADGP
jgi:hypothetical protein